jgi:hypothetical protein
VKIKFPFHNLGTNHFFAFDDAVAFVFDGIHFGIISVHHHFCFFFETRGLDVSTRSSNVETCGLDVPTRSSNVRTRGSDVQTNSSDIETLGSDIQTRGLDIYLTITTIRHNIYYN